MELYWNIGTIILSKSNADASLLETTFKYTTSFFPSENLFTLVIADWLFTLQIIIEWIICKSCWSFSNL